jgi:ABC-type microcin C transport system permease subunit YejB
MQHRVYKLKNSLTIFGLEYDDLGVAAVSFFLGNGVLSAVSDFRFNIVLIVAFAAGCTFLWLRLKDNLPDNFFKHGLAWLAEKDKYYSTVDFEPAPLIVDPGVSSVEG